MIWLFMVVMQHRRPMGALSVGGDEGEDRMVEDRGVERKRMVMDGCGGGWFWAGWSWG